METGKNQALFPWYKERLQTKYLKPSTSGFPSLCWYKATDDSSSAISWAHVGISPVIFTNNLKHPCIYTSTKVPKQAVSKKHACFSRQMIQKQRRREYVAAVEDELRQPLAQYQQYKDYMSAEVFDKVLSVLCPDTSLHNNNPQNATSLPFENMEKDAKNK